MNIPTNASELHGLLSDKAKVAELSEKGELGNVINAYAVEAAKRERGNLTEQINEQVQNTVIEFMRENGSTPRKAAPVANGNVTIYNAAAPGAKLNAKFDSTHDFFNTIWHRNNTAGAVKVRDEMTNAASSYTGADGGFLVPEETRSALLELSLESGIVRPRATVIPMNSPSVALPMVDDTSHVSSLFGGVTTSWESEGQSSTASNPTFAKAVLQAHKLKAYTQVPNELLRDGIAFEAFLNNSFPRALAYEEDYAFMHGTGVGQPKGFYNSDAAIVVAKESGQAADTVLWENIVKMYSRMLPESLNSAVWIVPQDVFPELATMALSVGTGGSAIWLNNGVAGPPMTILGRPVIVTEKAPKLGDEGDITFADLRYYLVGDYQTMTAESSPHYKFQEDVTAFKVLTRVDGRAWLNSALTPRNGGPTLSPFVKLAERA
jgi:HK97 family phage major capsid protein